MVLESIAGPLSAEKHPWYMLLFGILVGLISVALALWIFHEQAGMVMVFMAVMALLPLFYHTMRFEEKEDLELPSEKKILLQHSKALMFFMTIFAGMTVGFTLAYVFLPSNVATSLFMPQTSTIANLNQQVTGNAAAFSMMSKIFLNNMKVMIFSLLFACIFGSGAIFILTWNATVISAALGNFVRSKLTSYAAAHGFSKMAGYFYVGVLALFRYTIHGIPEILAYFVAGLAGGILSASIIRKDYEKVYFDKVLIDVSDLVIIAVLLLFVGAVLEVFVTPIFFK